MALKDLLESGTVTVAKLPPKNDFLFTAQELDLTKLEKLKGYTVPLIAHDYGGAKTPLMWNTLYELLDLSIRTIMVVADPNKSKEILSDLKSDPKYLGGGAGVGFKEKVIPFLDLLSPEDVRAVNILVKEGNNLVGYNTDALGFVRSLEEALAKVGKKVEGSNLIVYGAGGVAKEVTKLLAERRANYIRIVNRDVKKAVALANFLNERYRTVAEGVGETLSRGVVLNSGIPVDALINLSDKGSDGPLVNVAMYAAADAHNETESRDLLRYLKKLRIGVVIADIVLPKVQPSVSLRLASAEGIENLLDGNPMVIYQAVPAYLCVQKAHSNLHTKQLTSDKILEIFKEAAQ